MEHCHFLLHRIFPTQGSNPGLLNCRQILYHLSHRGSLSTVGVSLFHIVHLLEGRFSVGSHWCHQGSRPFFHLPSADSLALGLALWVQHGCHTSNITCRCDNTWIVTWIATTIHGCDNIHESPFPRKEYLRKRQQTPPLGGLGGPNWSRLPTHSHVCGHLSLFAGGEETGVESGWWAGVHPRGLLYLPSLSSRLCGCFLLPRRPPRFSFREAVPFSQLCYPLFGKNGRQLVFLGEWLFWGRDPGCAEG